MKGEERSKARHRNLLGFFVGKVVTLELTENVTLCGILTLAGNSEVLPESWPTESVCGSFTRYVHGNSSFKSYASATSGRNTYFVEASIDGPECDYLWLAKVQMLPSTTAKSSSVYDLVAVPWTSILTVSACRPSSVRSNLKSDSELIKASGGDPKERNLQSWCPPTEDLGQEDMNWEQGNQDWDQFETNRTKYGYKSTYKEELYTTALKLEGIPKEYIAKANETHPRMQDENSEEENEELQFSAVIDNSMNEKHISRVKKRIPAGNGQSTVITSLKKSEIKPESRQGKSTETKSGKKIAVSELFPKSDTQPADAAFVNSLHLEMAGKPPSHHPPRENNSRPRDCDGAYRLKLAKQFELDSKSIAQKMNAKGWAGKSSADQTEPNDADPEVPQPHIDLERLILSGSQTVPLISPVPSNDPSECCAPDFLTDTKPKSTVKLDPTRPAFTPNMVRQVTLVANENSSKLAQGIITSMIANSYKASYFSRGDWQPQLEFHNATTGSDQQPAPAYTNYSNHVTGPRTYVDGMMQNQRMMYNMRAIPQWWNS